MRRAVIETDFGKSSMIFNFSGIKVALQVDIKRTTNHVCYVCHSLFFMVGSYLYYSVV